MTKLTALFLICLTISPTIRSEPVPFSINTKKWSHVLDDHFISITVNPTDLLQGKVYGLAMNSTMAILKGLAPAYVRIGSADTAKYIFKKSRYPSDMVKPEDEYIVTETHWMVFNEVAQSAGLDVIVCLNAAHRIEGSKKWDTRNSLELISFSDSQGYNLTWQLGYEVQAGEEFSGIQFGKDLNRLRTILNAFPRYQQSKLIGPDIRIVHKKEDIDFWTDMLLEAGPTLDAVTWHPRWPQPSKMKVSDNSELGYEFPTDYLDHDKVQFNKILQKSAFKNPVWIGETKTESTGTFAEGLMWARRLVLAAKLGIEVVMKQPNLMDVTHPKPEYWIALLHKRLLGKSVLETRSNTNHTDLAVIAHCTNPSYWSDKPEKLQDGAVTIYGVNMGGLEQKIQIKGTWSGKSQILFQYVLTSGSDPDSVFSQMTYLNGEPLMMTDDGMLPDIIPKLKKLEKSLTMKLPPYSIGFWVVPEAKVKICQIQPHTVSNVENVPSAAKSVPNNLQNIRDINQFLVDKLKNPESEEVPQMKIEIDSTESAEKDLSLYSKENSLPRVARRIRQITPIDELNQELKSIMQETEDFLTKPDTVKNINLKMKLSKATPSMEHRIQTIAEGISDAIKTTNQEHEFNKFLQDSGLNKNFGSLLMNERMYNAPGMKDFAPYYNPPEVGIMTAKQRLRRSVSASEESSQEESVEDEEEPLPDEKLKFDKKIYLVKDDEEEQKNRKQDLLIPHKPDLKGLEERYKFIVQSKLQDGKRKLDNIKKKIKQDDTDITPKKKPTNEETVNDIQEEILKKEIQLLEKTEETVADILKNQKKRHETFEDIIFDELSDVKGERISALKDIYRNQNRKDNTIVKRQVQTRPLLKTVEYIEKNFNLEPESVQKIKRSLEDKMGEFFRNYDAKKSLEVKKRMTPQKEERKSILRKIHKEEDRRKNDYEEREKFHDRAEDISTNKERPREKNLPRKTPLIPSKSTQNIKNIRNQESTSKETLYQARKPEEIRRKYEEEKKYDYDLSNKSQETIRKPERKRFSSEDREVKPSKFVRKEVKSIRKEDSSKALKSDYETKKRREDEEDRKENFETEHSEEITEQDTKQFQTIPLKNDRERRENMLKQITSMVDHMNSLEDSPRKMDEDEGISVEFDSDRKSRKIKRRPRKAEITEIYQGVHEPLQSKPEKLPEEKAKQVTTETPETQTKTTSKLSKRRRNRNRSNRKQKDSKKSVDEEIAKASDLEATQKKRHLPNFEKSILELEKKKILKPKKIINPKFFRHQNDLPHIQEKATDIPIVHANSNEQIQKAPEPQTEISEQNKELLEDLEKIVEERAFLEQNLNNPKEKLISTEKELLQRKKVENDFSEETPDPTEGYIIVEPTIDTDIDDEKSTTERATLNMAKNPTKRENNLKKTNSKEVKNFDSEENEKFGSDRIQNVDEKQDSNLMNDMKKEKKEVEPAKFKKQRDDILASEIKKEKNQVQMEKDDEELDSAVRPEIKKENNKIVKQDDDVALFDVRKEKIKQVAEDYDIINEFPKTKERKKIQMAELERQPGNEVKAEKEKNAYMANSDETVEDNIMEPEFKRAEAELIKEKFSEETQDEYLYREPEKEKKDIQKKKDQKKVEIRKEKKNIQKDNIEENSEIKKEKNKTKMDEFENNSENSKLNKGIRMTELKNKPDKKKDFHMFENKEKPELRKRQKDIQVDKFEENSDVRKADQKLQKIFDEKNSGEEDIKKEKNAELAEVLKTLVQKQSERPSEKNEDFLLPSEEMDDNSEEIIKSSLTKKKIRDNQFASEMTRGDNSQRKRRATFLPKRGLVRQDDDEDEDFSSEERIQKFKQMIYKTSPAKKLLKNEVLPKNLEQRPSGAINLGADEFIRMAGSTMKVMFDDVIPEAYGQTKSKIQNMGISQYIKEFGNIVQQMKNLDQIFLNIGQAAVKGYIKGNRKEKGPYIQVISRKKRSTEDKKIMADFSMQEVNDPPLVEEIKTAINNPADFTEQIDLTTDSIVKMTPKSNLEIKTPKDKKENIKYATTITGEARVVDKRGDNRRIIELGEDNRKDSEHFIDGRKSNDEKVDATKTAESSEKVLSMNQEFNKTLKNFSKEKSLFDSVKTLTLPDSVKSLYNQIPKVAKKIQSQLDQKNGNPDASRVLQEQISPWIKTTKDFIKQAFTTLQRQRELSEIFAGNFQDTENISDWLSKDGKILEKRDITLIEPKLPVHYLESSKPNRKRETNQKHSEESLIRHLRELQPGVYVVPTAEMTNIRSEQITSEPKQKSGLPNVVTLNIYYDKKNQGVSAKAETTSQTAEPGLNQDLITYYQNKVWNTAASQYNQNNQYVSPIGIPDVNLNNPLVASVQTLQNNPVYATEPRIAELPNSRLIQYPSSTFHYPPATKMYPGIVPNPQSIYGTNPIYYLTPENRFVPQSPGTKRQWREFKAHSSGVPVSNVNSGWNIQYETVPGSVKSSLKPLSSSSYNKNFKLFSDKKRSIGDVKINSTWSEAALPFWKFFSTSSSEKKDDGATDEESEQKQESENTENESFEDIFVENRKRAKDAVEKKSKTTVIDAIEKTTEANSVEEVSGESVEKKKNIRKRRSVGENTKNILPIEMERRKLAKRSFPYVVEFRDHDILPEWFGTYQEIQNSLDHFPPHVRRSHIISTPMSKEDEEIFSILNADDELSLVDLDNEDAYYYSNDNTVGHLKRHPRSTDQFDNNMLKSNMIYKTPMDIEHVKPKALGMTGIKKLNDADSSLEMVTKSKLLKDSIFYTTTEDSRKKEVKTQEQKKLQPQLEPIKQTVPFQQVILQKQPQKQPQIQAQTQQQALSQKQAQEPQIFNQLPQAMQPVTFQPQQFSNSQSQFVQDTTTVQPRSPQDDAFYYFFKYAYDSLVKVMKSMTEYF